MRTAEECRAKARKLSDDAERAMAPELKASLLRMSQTWADLAGQADWQDAHPMSETYRIRWHTTPVVLTVVSVQGGIFHDFNDVVPGKRGRKLPHPLRIPGMGKGGNFRNGSILTVRVRGETHRSRCRGPAALNGEFPAVP